MRITASGVLSELVTIFPGFGVQWNGPDNYFRGNDGSFTHHGVFAEFTAYCRKDFENVSADQLRLLSVLLNEWFEGPDVDLDNAVATCFLENIAGEPCSRRLKLLLKPSARAFVGKWEPAT